MGVYEGRGNFIIDKFSGSETAFNVFSLNPTGNYLKSMNIQDRRGNIYSNIVDKMSNYHIFSLYKIPFQTVS